MAFTAKLAVFINNNETVELVKAERAIDFDASVNGLILKNLSKEVGEDQIVTVLTGLILRASSFFNITNNLSEDQAIETAYMLLDRFSTETIEDFVLMFKNAKAGKYGKLFNRLDGQIIIEWMGLYLEEKAEFREKEHQKLKSNSLTESNEITKLIEVKIVENQRSVIDALKEGLDFESDKQKEIDYIKYRNEFLKNRTETDGK